MIEDGAKHTLILYNLKAPLSGEILFTAANAKCVANLKVKGEMFRFDHVNVNILWWFSTHCHDATLSLFPSELQRVQLHLSHL